MREIQVRILKDKKNNKFLQKVVTNDKEIYAHYYIGTFGNNKPSIKKQEINFYFSLNVFTYN